MTSSNASERINLFKQVPDVYQAMLGLDTAARQGVDPILAELVLTRASQINHCAWCLDMHTKDALKAGERSQRLHLLAAWEETGDLFTAKERAALTLTEAVTVLTDGFVPDAVYDHAAEHFDDQELGQLISLVVAINAWNRISVSTRRVPPVS